MGRTCLRFAIGSGAGRVNAVTPTHGCGDAEKQGRFKGIYHQDTKGTKRKKITIRVGTRSRGQRGGRQRGKCIERTYASL